MNATTGAMKNVDIRNTLIPILVRRVPSRNVMVLRMPAARFDLLILLQSLDELCWKSRWTVRDRNANAGRVVSLRDDIISHSRLDHARVNTLAPKSTVKVSPTATVKFAP